MLNKGRSQYQQNFFVILLGCFLLSSSGCSVMMAMSGKKDANISVLEIGQDRGIVVANLGEPVKTVALEGKRVDVFELQRGNAPSAGRALGHGALDLLTLGFWEIIGTPVEVMQGETYTLTVEYDENDKVTKVSTGDAQQGANL